jgi:rSAM/selenodomain-associated transferase 1
VPIPRDWRAVIAVAELVIAQLARAPQPGAVKTRMQPVLSPQRAAELHAAMVSYICERLASWAPLQLWIHGDEAAPVFEECLAAGAGGLYHQQGEDLGARMAFIAEAALAEYRKVLLVGSDAPAIDPAYLSQAAQALDEVDVVFGPALDGGYVLLGLSSFVPGLFENIPWGSGEVLRRSIEVVEACGVGFSLLEPLPDIDRPEDLRYLPEDLDW